jgi:hypothetical protein
VSYTVPTQPKIYHILHEDRLASVLTSGCLLSDAVMSCQTGVGTVIGMSTIKARRLTMPVSCRPGTCVGDYVPFYFCPRSVMLYVIWQANHPELVYRGGQDPIITLEADLHEVVDHAEKAGKPWAFSLANAAARYVSFRANLADLAEIRWDYVAATRWSGRAVSPDVKEAKQAEFLLYGSFPWSLVRQVGVTGTAVRDRVAKRLADAAYSHPVHVRKDWYY